MTRSLILLSFLFITNYFFASDKKKILFDESHGQIFTINQTGDLQLSKLSAIFKNKGWEVNTCSSEITDEMLKGVDALIISGAFKPFSQPEIETIVRFIKNGGKLSIMLHIGPPVADLLHDLHVSISNGVIHETENIINNNDLDFNVTQLEKHSLLKGLKQLSVFGGWALLPTDETVKIIAQTQDKSWIDLNRNKIFNEGDAQQSFAIIVSGSVDIGKFVVFADDAIFQNRFLETHNSKLGSNLEKWLKN